LKQTKQVIFGYERWQELRFLDNVAWTVVEIIRSLTRSKAGLMRTRFCLQTLLTLHAGSQDSIVPATHNLKASNNALLKSDPLSKKPSRDFQLGSVKFGCQTICGPIVEINKRAFQTHCW